MSISYPTPWRQQRHKHYALRSRDPLFKLTSQRWGRLIAPGRENTFTSAMKLRFQQGNLPILFLFHMFNPAEVVTSLSGHVLFTSSTSGYLSHILVTILPNTFSCHPLVTSRKISSRFQSQALIYGQRPAEENACQDRGCQIWKHLGNGNYTHVRLAFANADSSSLGAGVGLRQN